MQSLIPARGGNLLGRSIIIIGFLRGNKINSASAFTIESPPIFLQLYMYSTVLYVCTE